MKELIEYQSNDGQTFKTKKECLEYEVAHTICNEKLDIASIMSNLCDHYVRCESCPYFNNGQDKCKVLQFANERPF